MRTAYLYLNAALYLLFAGWCTLAPWRTATNLGYASLAPGGRSEYLVIYGGLQLGLAALFTLLARDETLQPTGILFSVLLYGFIVVYRVVTVVKFGPVGTVTLATGCLEGVLLIGAVWLQAARG